MFWECVVSCLARCCMILNCFHWIKWQDIFGKHFLTGIKMLKFWPCICLNGFLQPGAGLMLVCEKNKTSCIYLIQWKMCNSLWQKCKPLSDRLSAAVCCDLCTSSWKKSESWVLLSNDSTFLLKWIVIVFLWDQM